MIELTSVVGLMAMLAQAPAPGGRPEPATGAASPSAAAEALARGDAIGAATLAGQAIEAQPEDPWAHYNRAAALARLGQVDEAVTAYRAAEARFGDQDTWGRSVAVWGRAHTLYQARRCEEAAAAFREYAALVAGTDPDGAALASRRAETCRPAAP